MSVFLTLGAFASDAKTGWKAYNFTIANYRAYITDDIRRNREPTQIAVERVCFKAATFGNLAKMNPANMVARHEATI